MHILESDRATLRTMQTLIIRSPSGRESKSAIPYSSAISRAPTILKPDHEILRCLSFAILLHHPFLLRSCDVSRGPFVERMTGRRPGKSEHIDQTSTVKLEDLRHVVVYQGRFMRSRKTIRQRTSPSTSQRTAIRHHQRRYKILDHSPSLSLLT